MSKGKEIIGEPLVIGGRTLSLSRAVRAGDLIYLTGSTDTDRLAATHKWLTERRWNGHELGAIATSLPAMVKHIDKALASVMLDVIADAV